MDMTIIDHRLAELRTSLASGQEQLQAFEDKRRELQATMLRISGAIQGIEEIKRDMLAPQDGN